MADKPLKEVWIYRNTLAILLNALSPPKEDWLPTVYASSPGRKYVAIPLVHLEEHEECVCHCGMECGLHTEADNHTAVEMERPDSAWDLLRKAAKRLHKVKDPDLRNILTDVINAVRRGVEFEPDGGPIVEAADKYFITRRNELRPTTAYLQQCAEQLHTRLCDDECCSWHTSSWERPCAIRKRYLEIADRILNLGIDIDDATKVLIVWHQEHK